MFWLLLATGFTGGLTLVFVIRWLNEIYGTPSSVEMYFLPESNPADVIVGELQKAAREVLVQGLSFTSAAIARALVECKSRGLTVEVLLDASDEQDLGSQLHYLREQGLAPAVDDSHALLRRQAIVIDRKTVITGSAPLGEPGQAEGAADVLLVMRGHSDLARTWRADLFAHKEHARPLPAAQPASSQRGPELGEFTAEDAA